MMKELSCKTPGEFEYKNAQKPVLSEGRAIIQIKRIGICGTDLHAFEGTQPYFSYPRTLGHELAGEVSEIESNSDFQKGDLVTIMPYFSCGTCVACRKGKTNCCQKISVLVFMKMEG